MAGPAVSVVVPTCGRPQALGRLLTALAYQDGAPPFEVLVVADGAPDHAVGVEPARPMPFPVRVLTQPALGPASARNRGALAARAPVLLFMDDDVEPGRTVIRAHAAFHAERTRAIGAGDLAPRPVDQGFIGQAIAGWWERMCDGLYDPRHRFTFRDLLTGHCSVPRALFAELTGFDTSFRCHEDFEFGYRAMRAGAHLAFVRDARAVHHDGTRLSGILSRKFDEGKADVQLVRRHPGLLRALPLGRALAAGAFVRHVHETALRVGGATDLRVPALPVVLRAFEALGMRDKWRAALERAMDFAYWRGVTYEAGGAEAVRAIRAQVDPPPLPPLTVDLQGGLEEAEALVDRARPASVRIVVGPYVVGDLAEQPGAEPLRGIHLRPLLLKDLAAGLVRAARDGGRLPPVFGALVEGGPTLTEPTAVPAPHVAPAGLRAG